MLIRIRKTAIIVLAGLVLVVLPVRALSQIKMATQSSFNTGYHQSSSPQAVMKSTAGQVLFIGPSRQGNTMIKSGYYLRSWSGESALAINEKSRLPVEYALRQNYPNPFNPSTTLRYELPIATDVVLVVYDILGREVIRLVDEMQDAGYHQVQWNGRDRFGRELASGIYITRLVTHQYTKSRKMFLLK